MTTNKVTASAPKNFSKPVSKYKPEYCEMLIEHMAEGYSFEAFAGLLKVNRTTLYNWVALHPEFKEAKSIADERSRYWAESQLKEQIKGTLKSHPVPLLFFMKNRFPNEWRDRKEIDVQKNDAESSKTLTLDEQLAKVEAMRAHLLQLKASESHNEVVTLDVTTN